MINPDKITIDRGMQILRRLDELNTEYEALAKECGAPENQLPMWAVFRNDLEDHIKEKLFSERLATM